MSQGGQLQGAWGRRRRRLGDSVPGCLLFIAIVIGGSIWSYFKFIHWRPLTLAGHNHKTFAYKKNSAAYLEYGRRMRTGFGYQVRGMCQQNADMIKKFKRGEYKENKAEFDTDTSTFCNTLLDFIQQFDGQQVPDVLERSHAKISSCCRLCYESTQALREAYGAEGAEQTRLVKEAEKKLKEAWETGNAGVKLHDSIWARTST